MRHRHSRVPSHVKSDMKCFALALGAPPGRSRRFSGRDDLRLQALTKRHFPEGFSILAAKGGWYDPARNRFIVEESRQITVRARHARVLAGWCRELAEAFRQKELLVIELGRARTFRFPGGSK